jgi:hypothetical protein
MLLAGLVSIEYLLAGLADAVADGASQAPTVARLLNLSGQATFIATFFLMVLAPLLLFPTGTLPTPRWRWTVWTASAGAAASVLSVLIAPGLVDEDVPAWGDNPLGVEALSGLVSALEGAGLALGLVTLLGGLAAFAVRWIRYRGPRRRQLAWFSVGVSTMLLGLITEFGGSVLVEVATALAIFGTLLVGMGWPLLGPLGRAADAQDHHRTASSAHAPRAAASTRSAMREPPGRPLNLPRLLTGVLSGKEKHIERKET